MLFRSVWQCLVRRVGFECLGMQSQSKRATIVHQMIECVKVYPDGRLDIIFGGGYLIEERLEKES